MAATVITFMEDHGPFVESSAHAEEQIRNLVHELRQPLSTIEAIAYYLEMTLPAEQLEARRYLSRLQAVVQESNALLVKTIRDSKARETATTH